MVYEKEGKKHFRAGKAESRMMDSNEQAWKKKWGPKEEEEQVNEVQSWEN